jgi:molybdopterin converting factor small subunit
MTVRVLLFASYADAVGRNELTLDVADGSLVGDIVAMVREMESIWLQMFKNQKTKKTKRKNKTKKK